MSAKYSHSLLLLFVATLFSFASQQAVAVDNNVNSVASDSVVFVTDTVYVEVIKYVEVDKGALPKAEVSKKKDVTSISRKPNHFTWGADLGSTMDLTNQSLTSFDLSACFGYRHKAMRFIGLGAGINVMVTNASRAYPVFAQVRTTFTPQNKLIFMDVKAGIAFLNLYDTVSRKPFYGCLGVGVTLASGLNFSSHIIFSYNFMPTGNIVVPEQPRPIKPFHGAAIRLGAAF